jgi:restriction endonuclease S subunit
VLSNGNGTYIRAREILLQYFDIVAIAELGSGTFGKTGTNTVTLFLRRKPTTPDTATHYLGRVAEWFTTDDNQPVYRDAHLIAAYAAHIGVPLADYQTLLQGVADGAWTQHDHFEEYKKKFNDSSEVDKLAKQRAFKAFSAEAKEAELHKRFLVFAQAIERGKLYHFVMASDQDHPVLVVRGPTETKAQKRFLGYDWSSAKGGEGIKLLKDSAGRHATLLYDEEHRSNLLRINHYIAENFAGRCHVVPPELAHCATYFRLTDLLDFGRPLFEAQIALTVRTRRVQTERWPSARVSDLVEVIIGGTPDTDRGDFWGGSIPWLSVADFSSAIRYVDRAQKGNTELGLKNSSTKMLQPGDLIISARGTVGALAQLLVPMAFNQSCYGLRSRGVVSNDYVFYALKREIEEFKALATGSKFDAITTRTFDEVRLPIPDEQVCKAIVDECGVVDAEVVDALAQIHSLGAQVTLAVSAQCAAKGASEAIDALATTVQYGLNEAMNEAGTGYKIFRMNEIVQRRMFDSGQMKCADISAEEFAKYKLNRGDVLFNRTNGSIDQVGKVGIFDLDGDYCFASYLVRVIPDPAKVIPQFLCLMMSSETFRAEARGQAVKSAGQININATKMRSIKVPAPPLAEQKRLVAKVQKLEQQIADAQAVIAAAPARKQAILQRYL